MTKKSISNYALWSAQVVLALLFLFAGGMKLLLPAAELTRQMPMPAWFLKFIGLAETLGGLGLVLPGIFRIQEELTSLAAVGLTIIMAGATVLTVAGGAGSMAAMPLVVGMLTSTVAYCRYQAPPTIQPSYE